jgi:peptide/nickel transport system substrate-binding protein/oligopeptide transport system substrate-binding protein
LVRRLNDEVPMTTLPDRLTSQGQALTIRLLLGAGVLALCALACGQPAPLAPDGEQVFRFRLREDPPTLDPALSTDNLSEAVVMNLFRGLVFMNPETLRVRPAVASSWTISEDRLRYVFSLRDDVRFHNGRRVTTDDVRYSFERLLRKEVSSPRRFVLEPLAGAAAFSAGESDTIAGLEVIDDRTVALRLEKPFAPFLAMLSMAAAALVPREVYDDPQSRYLRAPVGCGPFRLTGWEQSNFIELRAFDDYFAGRPHLDRVVVRIIENRESALQEYRAGGLDSLDEPPGPDTGEVYAELQDEVLRFPYIATGYIGFNTALPPFRDNATLRKAFNYAVDKDYLWEVLMPRGNTAARGIIPPGIPGFDDSLPGYPHDPERARRLLAEAGYPGGEGLPDVTLWVNTSEDNRRIAQQVQADLRKVGVALMIREVDWGAYMAAVAGTAEHPGEAQMFRFGWFLDYPDADAILRMTLHSDNIGPLGNFFRYDNPEFDRLVDEALVLTDPDARAALYREAERIAVMDDAVWLFLNYYESSTLFKPYVKGIVPTPLGEFRIPLELLRIEIP